MLTFLTGNLKHELACACLRFNAICFMTLSNAHNARASGRAMNFQDPLKSAQAHTHTHKQTHIHTHTQTDSCYPKGQAIVAKRADSSVRAKLGQMFFSHFLQCFFFFFFFFFYVYSKNWLAFAMG